VLNRKHVATLTLGLSFLITGLITALAAQTPGDQPPYQETLQQRMQRSVSHQMESAARMQGSLDRQRRSAQRQTGDAPGGAPGDAADAVSFFALPRATPMMPRGPAAIESPRPIDSNNDNTVEHDNADSAPEPSRASDAPPAHLMPLTPIASVPIPGIPGIPGIPELGAGAGQAGKTPKAVGEEKKEGAASPAVNGVGPAVTGAVREVTGATALRNAGGPYIQQLMQALGNDGSGTIPGLVNPPLMNSQQGLSVGYPGSYSGRDNAPLTSLSLVNWLFGL
jgi:hypothetical protein